MMDRSASPLSEEMGLRGVTQVPKIIVTSERAGTLYAQRTI